MKMCVDNRSKVIFYSIASYSTKMRKKTLILFLAPWIPVVILCRMKNMNLNIYIKTKYLPYNQLLEYYVRYYEDFIRYV